MNTSEIGGDGEFEALVALSSLDALSPMRLRLLVEHHPPAEALRRLRKGSSLAPGVGLDRRAELLGALRRQAAAARGDELIAECERLGIRVLPFGDPQFPDALAQRDDAPRVLYVQGDLEALAARRVGIVGTRNATAAGRATAADLAHELAADGVAVVSGLARGIDAAAHRGVRSAGGPGRAVAVVGNGLDRVYPRQNAELWRWVSGDGLLLSEWPPGIAPVAWRFPQRNRVIAALSEVLVVVESRETGGSLITARLAIDDGATVMAVPGSPRSRASLGTNQLLVEGAAPVTCTDDVRVALGLDHRRQFELPFEARPTPEALQASVLEVCSVAPCTLDAIVTQLGVTIADAALAVARLERDGWLIDTGGWFELAGSSLQGPR